MAAAYSSTAWTLLPGQFRIGDHRLSRLDPLATLPRMFFTLIRVPPSTGLPEQILGSTVMASLVGEKATEGVELVDRQQRYDFLRHCTSLRGC